MAIEHKQALRKFIGSGGDSEMSYSIDVEDGEILYHTHTVRYHDNRPGSGIVSSSGNISLDNLKNGLSGGEYYEAARAEVERQLQVFEERHPSPNIPTVLLSVGYLHRSHDYLFLLKRLTHFFPHGKTFRTSDVYGRRGDWPDPLGLAFDFPKSELRIVMDVLGVCRA